MRIWDFSMPLLKSSNSISPKRIFSDHLHVNNERDIFFSFYLISKIKTVMLPCQRNFFFVNMHCSLYCCIHSLCKPQSPTHMVGFLHGKIYIVMLLPKTTCCKPFHSFLHIENITHSSKKKKIIAF